MRWFRQTAAVVGAFATLLVAAVPVGAQVESPPSGSATDSTDEATGASFVLRSASPWVSETGTFTAEFEFANLPPEATISYRVRQRITGDEVVLRESLDALRRGDGPSSILHPPSTQPIAPITEGGVTTLSIDVRDRSTRGSDALYIPDAGTYPVDITVRTGSTTLLTTQLYLNRLPRTDDATAVPLRLAMIAELDQPLGSTENGEFSGAEAGDDVIAEQVDLLEQAEALPLALNLSPQFIVSMSAQIPESVDRLVRAADSAQIMSTTWADIDLESWATTGAVSAIRTSLLDGREALIARNIRPTESRVWGPDDTLGSRSVSVLDDLGFDLAVVHPDQLIDLAPPDGESGFTRPATLRSGSAVLNAMVLDPMLESLLTTETDQPQLAAHQLLTVLAASRLASTDERGAVLSIDDRTERNVLDALLSTLSASIEAPDAMPAVLTVPPRDLMTLASSSSGSGDANESDDWPIELGARDGLTDVSAISSTLGTARPLLDDYVAMVGGTDTVATRTATVVQRSTDQRLPADDQRELVEAAVATMSGDLAKITVSRPRSLNVTERKTTIPLRVMNELDRPVAVRLQLKSTRMRFLDGELQRITLEPGLNRLDLRVEVQTSGQFTMQAELLAPESDRVLASTRQRIRSTAFSGVGLILSGGALIFLIVWWVRTPRSSNDDTSADDTAASSTESPS